MTTLRALHAELTGDSSDLEAAARRAEDALDDVTAAQRRAGGGAKKAGIDARGLSLQLSQVGQSAMATGNIVQALAIQLPDIGLAFGTIGTAVGLLAGVALPVLISAFKDTGDKAQEAFEFVDELVEKAGTLKTGATQLNDVLKKTAERYDEIKEAGLNSSNTIIAASKEEFEARKAILRLDYTEMLGDAATGAVSLADAQNKVWEAEDKLFKLRDAHSKLTEDERNVPNIARNLEKDMAAAIKALAEAENAEERLRANLSLLDVQLGEISETLQTEFAGGLAEAITESLETGNIPKLQGELAQAGITLEEFEKAAEKAGVSIRKLSKSDEGNSPIEDFIEQLGLMTGAVEGSLHQQQGAWSSYFGDLANLAGSGGRKLLAIQKVINSGIAIQNSWLAYTEMLKDPSYVGRPWARFLAASKILAAGFGAVNAIRSASSSGGGGGGGSSAAPAPAAATDAGISTVRVVSDDPMMQAFAERLVPFLNRASDNGSRMVVFRT